MADTMLSEVIRGVAPMGYKHVKNIINKLLVTIKNISIGNYSICRFFNN